MLTCDEGRLRGLLLQEDHVLQERAVGRPAVPLQGRRAQVGREVGAGKQGEPLREGWEGQSLGLRLAGRPLGSTTGDVRARVTAAAPRHTPLEAYLQWRGRWQEVPV